MRIIEPQQLYRDLAPDMIGRDRRLRITAIGDDRRAEAFVEHDLGGTAGRTTRIRVQALAQPSKYELLEAAPETAADPRYTAILAAIAAVHHQGATPADYAQAAWGILEPTFAEHAHQLADRAAAEMSGCCDECDAAIAVMRNTIDPQAAP